MMSYTTILLLRILATFDGWQIKVDGTTLNQREIDAMPTGMYIHHENGDLIEVTREVKPGPTELALKNRPDSNTYHLFTEANPTHGQLLWPHNRQSLEQSHLTSAKPTHFITHGWMNSGYSPACTVIRDAYLEVCNCNVIILDWSPSSFGTYIWASNQVLSIGLEVARMIDFLIENGPLHPDDITLVGHSLGAHVMGLAGYYSKYEIGYVVGLDPALPMFQFGGPGSAISKMDAKQVQIIHTNGGFLGYLGANGHVDFYPNGGVKQPGCFPIDFLFCACSHSRAYYLYAESIRRPFYAVKCNSFRDYLSGYCSQHSVARMGGLILDHSEPGKYYFTTDFSAYG